MRAHRRLLSIGCVLGLAACGGAQLGTTTQEPACVIRGTMTSGELSVPDGSYAFALLSDAATVATVSEDAVLAHVEVGGLVLEGSLDHASALRAAHPLARGDDILLPTGTELNVLAARRDQVRIGLGRFAFTLEDGASWHGVPAAEVACDAIGLSFTYQDASSEARDWADLALPPATGTVWLPARQSVEIRPRPDAPVALTLTAPAHTAYAFHVVETRGASIRIVLQHWTGTVLVGWAAAQDLVTTAPAEAEATNGLLAALADQEGSTYEDCVAETDVDLSVRHVGATLPDGTRVAVRPTELVHVGTLAAGTHFVRREIGVDALSIAPDPQSHVAQPAGVQWLIPLVPVQCTTARQPGIADVLGSAQP